MQAVWNIIHPTRISFQKTIKDLLPAGQEFYGTVVKSVCPKTCVVQVSYKYWHRKYKKYFAGTSQFQVHDEENFAQIGDKVVIKHCQKLTSHKYYYVRNIVVATGRDNYYTEEPDSVMQELQQFIEYIYIREIRKQLNK